MTLRFAPEHGPHAPRMRASVFSAGLCRWILKVKAADGSAGVTEHATQDAAMAGIPALYAEITHQHTVPSPSEQIAIALLPGYVPSVNNTSDSGRVRLCSASRKDVTEDLVAVLEVLLSHAPTAPAWAVEAAVDAIKEAKGQS